jgi:hypothetical protein
MTAPLMQLPVLLFAGMMLGFMIVIGVLSIADARRK